MNPDSDPLAPLLTLEQTLDAASQDLAQVLADPPSDSRSTRLRLLWPKLAEHRVTYTTLVQALQGTVLTAPADTPITAAKRRMLLAHGKGRASLWDAVADMVARQSIPSAFPPLLTEKREIVRRAECGPTNLLMQVLFDLSNPDAKLLAQDTDTHHVDIPLSGAYFLNLLTAAQRILLAQGRSGPFRFLDVGCGAGSKVLTATAAFDVAHGFDFNAAYVARAQDFLKRAAMDPTAVWQDDALTFDDYGVYDVIYFYRPLKDPQLAARHEARVLEQARPGTILLAPLCASLGRPEIGAARVIDKIFLTGTSRDDATAILEEAQTKGCEMRTGVTHDETALGFWAPLVLQSQRNGFALR